MNKLARLRDAQRQVVKIQRRVWLVEVLMWPAAIVSGVLAVGGLLYVLRRRTPEGRHVMPETPGSHETGTVHIEPDGSLSAAP
ncbi:hypothetical protein A5724_12720 [Mycobacterium sp. ACS1612]|uniref:hypothetical protein n=1 Tax=Mycobacterium sp. ACS1612 TaxID=1834117 RepID=UPI0007FBB217|nr:hypothetical protein [Mycobacterium sp. ACS1612]OBF36726.1 hypothetical protein A5724_12720 [Mycobacterium sp. ACS1612]